APLTSYLFMWGPSIVLGSLVLAWRSADHLDVVTLEFSWPLIACQLSLGVLASSLAPFFFLRRLSGWTGGFKSLSQAMVMTVALMVLPLCWLAAVSGLYLQESLDQGSPEDFLGAANVVAVYWLGAGCFVLLAAATLRALAPHVDTSTDVRPVAVHDGAA